MGIATRVGFRNQRVSKLASNTNSAENDILLMWDQLYLQRAVYL